jgi:hypothetical protein
VEPIPAGEFQQQFPTALCSDNTGRKSDQYTGIRIYAER